MATKSLRIEPAMTECPMCGNVWQEHTLNEVDDCIAILHLEYSVALARDAKLKGKPIPNPTEEFCPVCNKLTSEHSDDDERSCVSKWRKREEGATGLEFQHSFMVSRVTARGQVEDPDPLKRAQLQAQMMQMLCSCGKANGDHTVDEIMACIDRERRS